ncbi:MAG TPA: NAD(P)-dependent oxidoreductase [Mycobacteriales bacterium]|jgi:3-hydroxyisobutyrate dehydrogenase
MTTVALLGTGLMGTGMARSMLRAGLEVRAWNRTREKAEAIEGVTVAGTPAEAVRGADVVVTMLLDAVAVDEAIRGAEDGLRPGMLWIQSSTVGVAPALRLAAVAERYGLVYVDAPVLGTRQPAEQGELTVLASGPEEARDRCAPVFDAIGSRVFWLGPAGTGSRLKMVVNSWVFALTEATAEAIALAEGLGLDPQLFLDTIAGTGTDSPYAHLKGKAMIAREFAPAFPTEGAEKDCRLILEAAGDAGVDMALTAAAQRHFAAALEQGHGHDDMASVFLVHRR